MAKLVQSNLKSLSHPQLGGLRSGTSLISRRVVQAIVQGGGGGGGTSPGTTGLVAWYDFANANDATGTYNLAILGDTPTYEAGPPSYGIATDGAPGAYWAQGDLDNNFGNTTGDWAVVLRFRARSGIVNNDLILTGNGGRTTIKYNTTAISGSIGSFTAVNSGVAGAEDTWFTVVVSHNNASSQISISVNGETFITSGVTNTYNVGTLLFAANSTSATHPVDIDFAGFYSKQLTQDNVTWLYNSGGTRMYAEL